MTQPHSTCPDCGAPLPADSPQSLCPACLLKQALASRTIVSGEDGTPPPPPPATEEIADKFPQFEVTECLGSGGMGVVYKARQKSLDRWVAIKILRPEKTGDERFAERFAREAQTLARMNHPNIVTVFDYGETGGLFYIVMEFVDGVNLRDLLREGKLEPEQALAIIPPICEALQYAHEKGIVHRDIKPENLLLDRDGRIKIADFGIASIIGTGAEASGTPPYMAPEQQGPSKVDHRADIYALGVVLYEMLTGERPGKDLVTPSRKAHTDVRLDEMVMRAMEQDPARRYQTAGEFRTMVERIQPEAAPPPSPPPGSSPPVRAQGMWRRFWWLLPVLIPIGILLGLGGGILQEYLAPKKYQSQAIVQILSSGNAMGEMPSDSLPVKLGQLTSPLSLQEVGRRLNLEQRWQLDPEMIEFKMRGMIEVQVIRGTSLVAIRVTSKEPTEAAEIANTVAEVSGTKASTLLHETAMPAHAPLQPAWLPVLVKSSLIGLLIAVLAAFPVMLLAHRRYLRKSGIPTRSRALKIIAVCLLCVVALVYGKPGLFQSRHRGDDALILGRVKVDFAHPEQRSGGFGVGFPAMQGSATPWRPNEAGQPVQLKDGRTGWGRARVVSHGAGSPVVVVSSSVDGLHWETQEAVLDSWPTGGKLNLDFTNGFKSQVLWMPAEEPLEGPRQGTSSIAVISGIALLVVIALVLILTVGRGGARGRLILGVLVLFGAVLLAGIWIATGKRAQRPPQSASSAAPPAATSPDRFLATLRIIDMPVRKEIPKSAAAMTPDMRVLAVLRSVIASDRDEELLIPFIPGREVTGEGRLPRKGVLMIRARQKDGEVSYDLKGLEQGAGGPARTNLGGYHAPLGEPGFLDERFAARGRKQVALLSFETSDSAPEPRPPATGGYAYGPVIECVVSDWNHSTTSCLIDFDTGKLFSIAPDSGVILLPQKEPDWEGYLEKEIRPTPDGAIVTDAFGLAHGDGHERKPGLVGTHLLTAPYTWKSKDAALLMDAFNLRDLEEKRKLPALTAMPFPSYFEAQDDVAWAFCTSEGRRGLLQVTGLSDDRKGVKIRYKLVEEPSVGWDGTAGVPPQAASVPEEVLLPAGLSPKNGYQVRIRGFPDDLPFSYSIHVYGKDKKKPIYTLPEAGGYLRYSAAKHECPVYWHRSGEFVIITDRGTQRSREIYLLAVSGDKVEQVPLPDFVANALGRIDATRSYRGSMVSPQRWEGDDLHLDLGLDTLKGYFTCQVVLELQHAPDTAPRVSLKSCTTPLPLNK